METLNKNWFAITLIAVIFFLLGFLIGKSSGPKSQMHKMMVKKDMAHQIITVEGDHQLDVTKGFEWVSDKNNNVIIDIDTTDGHKNVKVVVKKIQTED